MARKNGRVKNVSYDDKIKGKIIEEFVLWKDNNIVESYLTNKLGIIFLEFENQNQMMDLTSNIHKHINIEYF